jgi:hypothetical protein
LTNYYESQELLPIVSTERCFTQRVKVNKIYKVSDSRWLEIQFNIGHNFCALIGAEPGINFQEIMEKILSNDRAQMAVDKIERQQVTTATRALYADKTEMYMSVLQSVYKLHQWGAYGFNTFDVSPGLCQQLLLTDASSAPIVPMPYNTFFIRLVKGCLITSKGDSVIGIWIHSFVWQNDPPIIEIEVMTDAETESPIAFRSPWEDLFKLNITIINEHSDPPPIPVEDLDSEIVLVKKCAALAANLCFYLTSKQGQNESTGVPKKTRYDQRPGFNWPRCWGLGKKLVVDPRLSADSGAGAEQTKLKFKHVVRGHWRNQACGEGMRDRRVTWIQPYWKGPDVEEAWSHAYEVK